MYGKILVSYASKYGATEEIAQKIGEVLSQAGFQVDVFPVRNLKDLKTYNAVILGSAVYIGKWHKKAEGFLKANEKILASLPVWLFSSGPTGKGNPIELLGGQRLPTTLQGIANRIKPRDVAVFHGYINLEKINTMEKWAIKSVVKKPFGDFRDWDMIVNWTTQVAAEVKETELSSVA